MFICFALSVLGATAHAEKFIDLNEAWAYTDWELDAPNKWSRQVVDGDGDKAHLTLKKQGSVLEYTLTILCPNSFRVVSLSWKAGGIRIAQVTFCDGTKDLIPLRFWESHFLPHPDDIDGHKPAEIFISPEQWPPPIIA
jgi:hypothetical protein